MAAGTLAGACAGPAPRSPRNLLLITLDTVRADRLGAYGYAAATTPALDGLARAGVRFEQAQAAAPLTLPSHTTLLTGVLPPGHGVHQNGATAAGQATLAEHLAAAGYRTGAFVGAFVLDRRFGLAAGFERYDDEVATDPSRTAGFDAERPGREVVDRALEWLAADDPRPFFAWVHLFDAHAPYAPPEPHAAAHAGRPYDGEIAAVDAEVGRLLAFLAARGLEEATLVAVAGDHGESLGEHGEPTHGVLLYEPTLRVPLLLAGPGLPAGRVVREPVGLVDLAPTLAALAGHPWAAPGWDGRDLSAPLLAGEEPPRADLYAETEYPTLFGWSALAALRRGDRKVIEAPRPELYDLAADPRELANQWSEDATSVLSRRLAELRAARTARPAAAPADAETRARLASLGYVSGGETAAAPAEAGTERADPKDRIALFRELETARQEMGQGLLAAAAERLERIVAEDPANPVFRGTLAEVRRQQGDRRRAVDLYRQAVAANPEDGEAWYNLAVTLQEVGRAEEATRALAEAIRRRPDHPEAFNALGIALSLSARPEEARAAFARAVELDPENAKAWNNLGNTLRDGGRLAEAEAAYQRAIDLAPRYADPLNGLGTLEVERDRPSAAVAHFDRALELAPALHEVRLNRAIALELMGERERAAAGYREFLAATDGSSDFEAQRDAARRLLARVSPAASPPRAGGR